VAHILLFVPAVPVGIATVVSGLVQLGEGSITSCGNLKGPGLVAGKIGIAVPGSGEVVFGPCVVIAYMEFPPMKCIISLIIKNLLGDGNNPIVQSRKSRVHIHIVPDPVSVGGQAGKD